MAFRLHFGHIYGNLCVLYLLSFTICFFLSGLHFQLHNWNVRSLVTNIRYEHQQVKSWRSPSTNIYIKHAFISLLYHTYYTYNF